MKLFERFDKVYCINLDRRPDRYENFKNEVKKYDLGEFEKVSAVDGKNLDMSLFNTTLKTGELGLTLTNLEIIKDAEKNNFGTILILEDDCTFEPEIKNIEGYFNLLPSDWDMLYMGGNHNTHMGVQPPKKINEKVCKLHTTYSTHFVGLKKSVFEHIKVLLSKNKNPLDVCYVTLQKIFNVYSFYPAIAKQIVDFSDIQNYNTDYNWLIK